MPKKSHVMSERMGGQTGWKGRNLGSRKRGNMSARSLHLLNVNFIQGCIRLFIRRPKAKDHSLQFVSLININVRLFRPFTTQLCSPSAAQTYPGFYQFVMCRGKTYSLVCPDVSSYSILKLLIVRLITIRKNLLANSLSFLDIWL